MTQSKHKIGSTEDISDGERIIRDINGLEIAVFCIDTDYYAVANFCPHQAGPLCEGKLMGEIRGRDGWRLEYDDTKTTISCPWHGWQFDITTGANVQTDRYAVPTYDVIVEDGDIYVTR